MNLDLFFLNSFLLLQFVFVQVDRKKADFKYIFFFNFFFVFFEIFCGLNQVINKRFFFVFWSQRHKSTINYEFWVIFFLLLTIWNYKWIIAEKMERSLKIIIKIQKTMILTNNDEDSKYIMTLARFQNKP